MRNLGNIKISIMCDSYDIKFKYAMPQKIDLFALTLFEIIKHSQNFKGKTIKDVLLMLEFPQDLHYIFNDRLKELMKLNLVKDNNVIEANWIYEDDIDKFFVPIYRPSGDNLLIDIENYSLTPMGEKTYNSEEIIEEPQSWSSEYIYQIYETLGSSLTKRENRSDSQDAIMVELETLAENEVTDTFMRIITENMEKFIQNANPKTVIFDLVAVPTGRVGISDNISVSIDGGKLKFDNKNKKILNAFLSVSAEEKNSIRNKMFNYLDIPQTKIDFDKANIAVKRSQPIKMKIAFGKKSAIDAVTDTVHVLDVDQLDYSGVFDFCCFAGITDNGKSLVYNYCEINEQGYTLPLEELDYSAQNYNYIFSSIFETCKADIANGNNLENLINFAILASPLEKKTSVVTSIMVQTKDLSSVLVRAKAILETAGGNKAISDKVKDFIMDLVKENLSKGNIDVDAVIGIMKDIDLPKESTIKILAEGAPRTDETINALLAIDEAATVRIYELEKLYNSLLKNGNLSSITHNTNLYSAFLNYDRQYKKLALQTKWWKEKGLIYPSERGLRF